MGLRKSANSVLPKVLSFTLLVWLELLLCICKCLACICRKKRLNCLNWISVWNNTNEYFPNSFSILSILGRCLGKAFHRIRWKWFFPKEFQTAWRWQGMLVNETFMHSSFFTTKIVNSTQKTTYFYCTYKLIWNQA